MLTFKNYFELTEIEKLNLTFGKFKNKTPFKTAKNGIVTYSLYKAENTQFLKDIKKADFESDEIKKFIKRSAIYAARIIKDFEFDLLVMPKSSSPLIKTLIKELQKRIFIPIHYDSFQKQPDIKRIEINYDDPRITDKIIKRLDPVLRKAIKIGKLSLTKILPQNRKFLKNLFKVVDKKLLKKVSEKNILICDDIFTSGITIKNIADILTTNGAKKITGLTIFK